MNNNEHVSFLEHQGKYKGIFAWIFATDHKRIAFLYMYAIATFFLVGAILG
jgi:cytochrome c oxidase subunit 1